MKRVAILFTHGAWHGVDAAAGIDAALSLLAFEHELHVGFFGAGVELLSGSVDGDERSQCHRMVAALRHHGASSMVASRECLESRSLQPHLADIEIRPRAQFAAWLSGTDHVLCF
ncbi:MAG: DsrE family protein [Xanthomonadales bacterium]|nr:DsrE family protein [Xanthomonadales bacterium]